MCYFFLFSSYCVPILIKIEETLNISLVTIANVTFDGVWCVRTCLLSVTHLSGQPHGCTRRETILQGPPYDTFSSSPLNVVILLEGKIGTWQFSFTKILFIKHLVGATT